MTEQKTSGYVTAVSNKGDKYGITIGKDNWFNGNGNAPCLKGDNVEVTFRPNGNFRNIVDVKVIGAGDGSVTSGTSGFKPNTEIQQMSKLKNKTNMRICALTCAKDLSKDASPEEVMQTAVQFMKFLEDEENI